MKVTETTVRSSMASSQMTGQIDPITSELHRGSLKSMKEFGGEKPSLISRMYQSIKNFFCSIWNFIFGVKQKEIGFSERIMDMLEGFDGKCDGFDIYVKCRNKELKTSEYGLKKECQVCYFTEKIGHWAQSLELIDRRGQFMIIICPVKKGSWYSGDTLGDQVKIYSSVFGEKEYTTEKNPDVFAGLQQQKTGEKRLDYLVKHYLGEEGNKILERLKGP